MNPDRNQRWWAAFILVAVAPLILVNVLGLLSPLESASDDKGRWHGWPLALCRRSGQLHSLAYYGAAHQYHDIGDPRTPIPTSSRWPVDGAMVLWCPNPKARLFVNAIHWAVLLVSSGIACRASHWVNTGKSQVSLATLFVMNLVTAIYLGLFLKEVSADPACLLPAPTIVSAILGLREVLQARLSGKRRFFSSST